MIGPRRVLVRPLNAPPATVPAYGVQPGVSPSRGGNSFAATVVPISTGYLFYAGQPALGNLILALSSTGGTDKFGNVYSAPFEQLGTGAGAGTSVTIAPAAPGGQAVVSANAPAPLFRLNPTTATHMSDFPTVNTQVINPGTVNEFMITSVYSGASGGDSVGIQVVTEPPGAASPALGEIVLSGAQMFEFQGSSATGLGTANVGSIAFNAFNLVATFGTNTQPHLITTDSWNPVTMDAGWSTIAGFTPPKYRLNIDNTVDIVGAAQFSAAFTTQNLASGTHVLPALYRPANEQVVGGLPSTAGLEVTSAGVLIASGPSGTIVSFNGQIRLGI